MSVNPRSLSSSYGSIFIKTAITLIVVSLTTLLILRTLLHSFIASDLNTIIFEVKEGSTLNSVSSELAKNGIFPYPRIFSTYARIQGLEKLIQPGEYEITEITSPVSLLEKMTNGDLFQRKITLVEGWTIEQVLETLWNNETIIREIETKDPKLLADLLSLDVSSAEGMIFPDTYFFTKGATDISIIRRAHINLQNMLDDAWDDRLGGLPYDDPYEALTMASIIEKESSTRSEKGYISSVFINRLERGMRLQSDPTVIYGMGEDYDGSITRAALAQVTPFNTYRINGLPPSPIALAGLESLHASLNPFQSDYLYFVSQGDGSHYFSENLDEHNEAVGRFRRTNDLKSK